MFWSSTDSTTPTRLGTPAPRTLLEAIRFSAGVQDFTEEVESELVRARVLEEAAERIRIVLDALLKSGPRTSLTGRGSIEFGPPFTTVDPPFWRGLASLLGCAGLEAIFRINREWRLGLKCGSKDFFLGVSGLYKLVEPYSTCEDRRQSRELSLRSSTRAVLR